MPAPLPAFGSTGRLGTSGAHAVPNPSPSLDPAALGEIEAKDRTRLSGLAALGQAKVIAAEMCSAARAAHADQSLSMVDRHRTATSLAAKAVLPFLSTLELTQATYAREIAKLHEKLDGPSGDFSEIEVAEARSKLAGMQPTARFAAIKKSIDRGGDLIIAVLTRSDAFLADGLLSDAEQAVLINHWRQSRHPDEFARFQRLESDVAIIERAGRILQNYQTSVANPSIVANGIPPTPTVRGAPGPAPSNRGAAPSLEERAARMTAVLAGR